jgi:5-methylcytosine-specific restriction endonuclease McrA
MYERRWRSKNLEKDLANKRNHYIDNQAVYKEKAKVWRQSNPERSNELSKLWKQKNPGKCKEGGRRWRKENPEKHAAKERKRRAILRNVEHEPYTVEDIQDLWYSQSGCCSYCGTPLFSRYHVDHMIPISRGGPDKLANLTLACPLCNLQKHAKTAKEFREVINKSNSSLIRPA